MKLTVSWINQTPAGRTILLTKGASVLPNGMRSIGGESGFVSVATPEAKLAFQVGQEVEVSDNAVLTKRIFKNKEGAAKEIDAWINI